MKKKIILGFALIWMFVFYPEQIRAQQGTWRKFGTVTETFETFMRKSPLGNKYDSSMNVIRNVAVRSEAEAVIVSNSSGVILTYTERTIFESSGFNSATFSFAWGPMQRRYPIEMWTELRERTNDGIRKWIKGGDKNGIKHGDIDKDLVWIVENGLAGKGAAKGWGFNIAKNYQIGDNATINCTPVGKNHSFVMTIKIPLDKYFTETEYFTINERNGTINANLSFNEIISGIMKKSRLFGSDSFVLTKQ